MAPTYKLGPYLVTDDPPTDGLYRFEAGSIPLVEDPVSPGLFIMGVPFAQDSGLFILDLSGGVGVTPVVVRGMSAIATSTSGTLTIPLPSRVVNDFIVLYAELTVTDGSHNSTLPTLPIGYTMLGSTADANGFRITAYKRIRANEPNPVLALASGSAAGKPFHGSVEVYTNLDYHDPGWLDLPGAAGSYATATRTALGSAATLQMAARVSFDALGVANWISGWANGDVGFGLNSSNRPIMFLTNTVAGVIGNAAASADIPGLAAKQKIWLRARVTASTASCAYDYSFNDVENYDAVHWIPLGTPQVGTNAGTTTRVTNSGTVFIGAKDAATTPTKKKLYSFEEDVTAGTPNIAYHYGYEGVLPAGHALVGSPAVRAPTMGQSSPIEDWHFGQAPDPPVIPAQRVYGDGRLVVGVIAAERTGTVIPSPVNGPANWLTHADRAVQLGTVAFQRVLRTLPSAVDTLDAVFDINDSLMFPWVLSLTLRGSIPTTTPSTSPQPPRLVLGCPETYTTWITDGGYKRTIEQLHWGSISWERALDQISSASVVIPDEYGGANCLARAGGLEPWRYGLLIERNDQEVWSGPITTVARDGTTIVVNASDAFARYQKRFLTRDVIVPYVNTDVGTIFREVITIHAASSLDAWSLPVPDITAGVPLTRSLKPREFKYAWDLLSELLNSTLDAFIMNGVLYLWEPMKGWQYQGNIKRTLKGTYNSNYDLVYGTFTKESFAVRPNWTLDGMGQANFAAVPGADTGEYGFRTYAATEDGQSQSIYGLLDMADPDPVEIPQDTPPGLVADALQARADTVAALRAYPPITIESGTLSAQAPVSVDHLRPGSLWKLDVFDHGFGQLLSLCRLRRVTVTVTRGPTGIEEKVNPVLEPPGWEGGL